MDVSSQINPQQTGHLVEPFFVWCFLPTEKIIDFFESIKNHQLLNFEIFGVFLLGLMPLKKKYLNQKHVFRWLPTKDADLSW